MKTFLLLACLACTGVARRTQRADIGEQQQDGVRDMSPVNSMKMLSRMLMASIPETAFMPGVSKGPLPMQFGRALSPSSQPVVPNRVDGTMMMDNRWDIKAISPDGSLSQRVEGKTRQTWKFNDVTKDRVQVALTSEGRPVHSDIELWIGPDWTPFKCKAYTEDGKLRPIQTLVGTRHKAATIEVRNTAETEFALTGASNYVRPEMAAVLEDISATPGIRMDGGEISSFPVDPSADQAEVVLKTEGKQLNARIEILVAPNNPKQVFECFTNNGELNSLAVAFNTPDSGSTIRVVNLAPVEFPLSAHVREVSLGS